MSVEVVRNALMEDLTHIVGMGKVVSGVRALDVYEHAYYVESGHLL